MIAGGLDRAIHIGSPTRSAGFVASKATCRIFARSALAFVPSHSTIVDGNRLSQAVDSTMIQQLRVQGFRALADVTVRLGRFNVLIGPNDSGKTSFLEAAYAFARSPRTEIAKCFWNPWQGNSLIHKHANKPVRFDALLGSAEVSEDVISYGINVRSRSDSCVIEEERINEHVQQGDRTRSLASVRLNGDKVAPALDGVLDEVGRRLHSPTMTRWSLDDLGAISWLPGTPGDQPFEPTGYGLASCLADLKLSHDSVFRAIEKRFCDLYSEYKGIGFRRVKLYRWIRDSTGQRTPQGDGDGIEMLLQHVGGMSIPSRHCSGGTLIAIAFLTATALGNKLILAEEPENGLHPQRLKEMVDILRRAAQMDDESQVVITTHSPWLLDHVLPDEVRLFARNPSGDVEVFHVEADHPDIREKLKYGLLGELVFNDWNNFLMELRENGHPAHRGGAK